MFVYYYGLDNIPLQPPFMDMMVSTEAVLSFRFQRFQSSLLMPVTWLIPLVFFLAGFKQMHPNVIQY